MSNINKSERMEWTILYALIGFIVLLLLIVSLFSDRFFADSDAADSVYFNGNIYTMDAENPKASAIAVVGQKLVYVGDDDGVKAFIGKNTLVSDLKEKTVLPGLIDGHIHFPWLGKTMMNIDASQKSKAEILNAVKSEVSTRKPGEWIIGFGWDNGMWGETKYPTKEELDAVSPNNPVALTRIDGHMLWVSSKALKMSNITKESANPQGGEILRDADGNPTGCLTDAARASVFAAMPGLSAPKEKESMLMAQGKLFSYGITSIADAGSSIYTYNLMKELYSGKKLKVRVYGFIAGLSSAEDKSDINMYFQTVGPSVGMYDNRLSLNGVKLFADGSMGSSSAAFFQDYSDRMGHRGNLRFTDEELYQAMRMAYNGGYQVATHAIGDEAIDQVIRVYDRLMTENPRPDPRLRIEHFQAPSVADFQRIRALKILPSMQPIMAASDKYMAEERIGKERAQNAYAWRKVLDTGSIIIGGSDTPTDILNPYLGLYAAVTRMDRSDQPEGGWYASQVMTREEALKAFTVWASYGQFEEKIKGVLETGKLADFVVIDRDYFTCPIQEIKNINAMLTVVGGEEVYHMNTDAITVMWEGSPVKFELLPTFVDHKLMVQADILADKIGARITYDSTTKTVTALKNGKAITIPAMKMNEKVFLQLRGLTDGFGYALYWYNDSQTASITKS